MNKQHSLEDIRQDLREFVHEREWEQYHSPRNLAMAVSVEANELLELFLWCKDDGPQPLSPKRRTQVSGEVGDILMCLLNFCDNIDIDPLEAISNKLTEAKEKYPVDRVRGQALKYDEYPEWDGK